MARVISLTRRPFTIAVIAGLLVTDVPGARAAQWQYETAVGDTPLRICRRFTRTPGCSLALARLNDIPPRAPIASGTLIRIPAEWLKKVPIVGGVLETSAGAQYQAVDESGFAPVVAGEPVYLGDTILTGDGSVVLEFLSGLMIEVKPHSKLVLQSVVEREDDPVVDVDILQGAASIASEGDVPGGETIEDLDLNELAGADIDSALARAERMLEDAPTAAGGRAANGGATHEPTIADVLHGVLAPFAAGRGTLNSFAPAQLEWPREADARTWQVTLLNVPRRIDLKQVFVVDEPMLNLPELAAGCYEAEIRALDAEGSTAGSRTESLCVHPPLAAPELQQMPEPDSGAGKIFWNPVVHAAGYTVEFAADPEFEQVTASLGSVENSVVLPAGAAGSRYVRVRARNAAGMDGPPGPVRRLP